MDLMDFDQATLYFDEPIAPEVERLIAEAGAGYGADDTEARAGIALRVEVDDQNPAASGTEGSGEVDRGRGLADAAFLVGNGEDPGASLRQGGSR
jgi:hypothetical protein